MNVMLAYIGAIILLVIIAKIFLFPIKLIVKLIINSICGAILIWIVNLIGVNFGVYIGINVFTALFAGILGMPGAIILLLLAIL